MSAHTAARFDLDRLRRAVQERDAGTQLEMYAPDATVTIADRVTTPGAPRVLAGQEAIQTWLEDVCSRDMTHRIERAVADENGAAFTEACRYADGTNVLCATVFRVSDGLIVDQTVVQAWDEG